MAEVFSVPLNGAKADYHAYGYARIPGVFQPYEMEIIRAVATSIYPKYPDRVQWLAGGKPALLSWPMDISKVLNGFSHDDRMQHIVAHFLGPDVRIIVNQIYFRHAGDGDQFGWHQDSKFREPPEDFANIEDNYLQTIIAVDPMDDQSGAIEFIPGSHKWGDMNLLSSGSDPKLRKFVRGTWKGTKVAANPGDVLVWHPLVVHGSEPNVSPRRRMTYMSGFAGERAVKNKRKYPVYLKDGI